MRLLKTVLCILSQVVLSVSVQILLLPSVLLRALCLIKLFGWVRQKVLSPGFSPEESQVSKETGLESFQESAIIALA